MSDVDLTELMREALVEIERLQRKMDALDYQAREPIAVIGMACRFAGINSPEDLWQNLLDGTDKVSPVPAERWDSDRYFDPDLDAVGGIYCREGSFLDDIASFDPAFFGISAREAAAMDPQHRILLEVAWEAIERAGLPASVLKGSATGVFAGVMHQDYSHQIRNVADVDLYTAAGNAPSVLAGRLSHAFGLHGPTLTVDTACSSSLVAVHLACAALRARECDIAIVGGVNVVLSPIATAAESRAHMLSSTGRCRSFDDDADGFVRGEGCGVVVLQRQSDALSARRPIDALIAGSAVNHDGRSAGLTVPNEHAQRKLIIQALTAARIDASDVQFIEAHGTGTSLGDPIEVAALASVFAGGSKDAPVLLGSIKSNLGHTEGAAGIAGLIKTVLGVKHGIVPQTLHVQTPNRGIDWDKLPLRLAVENEPLEGSQHVAGVSSFGFSGTNAHAIVVSAPATDERAGEGEDTPQLLTISARSDASLRASAVRFANHLSRVTGGELEDICHSARVTKSHFNHRLAVISSQADDMAEKLRRFARGEPTEIESGVRGSIPVTKRQNAGAPDNSLAALARRYVGGETVDWSVLQSARSRLVPLPVYAFDRQKYWLNVSSGAEASQLHRINWTFVPTPSPTRHRGKRIVAGNDIQLCQDIVRRLEALGEECVIVGVSPEEILQAGEASLGIVLALTSQSTTDDPVSIISHQVSIITALARMLDSRSASGRVFVVTVGAASTGPSDHADPTAAAVNAAIRVARIEQGQSWGNSIDIDRSDMSLDTLAALLTSGCDEEEVALRKNLIVAPRLRQAGASQVMPEILDQSYYVITGGTGALGLATARWLVDRGARHLLLISRRGDTDSDVRDACAQLRSRGAEVRVARADIADEAALREALCVDRPIHGVIHCAGVIDDATLATMTREQLTAVLRAKVKGAYLLDRLLADQPLGIFLLFSSISAIVGRHGQAAYAAANAYLDALAQQRLMNSRPALSVGWGLWAAGMGNHDMKVVERIRAGGLHPLSEAEAFASLQKAFSGEAYVIIAALDAKQIALRPNLPRLIEGVADPKRQSKLRTIGLDQLEGHPAPIRHRLVADHLKAELAAILSSGTSLAVDVSLIELGVDSLTAAEFRNAIEKSTGVSVPLALLVDGSPLQAVIDLVVGQLDLRLVTQSPRKQADVTTEGITL
ncbi:type I polyketide synthase [Rhizobium skierniewicense]|uniref:type I polyketide synthase n=1 Tax=Rhizobium skierniewicense TaxID=984260 RepID=UPI001574664C|nr:SDR family NAD(P)-dependent oxidoreductase [Rhizobium skierniewicense]NTF35014.1 SDR family NAD(P)-dependent oxidoreductase [Rhizobium skierniewicense]